MSNVKIVDVIIRKTAEKTVLTTEGNLSVSISSPSVIEIHGSAQDVARYMRQGNDLLIVMKDGSVIRCNNYFLEDPEAKNHSELVFNDEQQLTHISFAETGDASGLAATELSAQATPIASIEPFLEQGSALSDAPWGWIAGAALGGGAIGALLANGSDGETKTKVVDNTKEVESATPTFMVTDKSGDKQGLLSAKEVTDDNTPTFSGTGQPGATIQVKDSSGNTIASTMVGSNGAWTVKLPTQTDGEHTWSVVQIDGSKTTGAGTITVTVDTAEATLTLATTAGDNVVNASEQSAGFTLAGSSTQLAQGTPLSVTLNGKTYAAEVGANGAWSVNVPAVDARALGDGSWTVTVSGKDAAGNSVTANQTLVVDTVAPTISVDAIAQDNIINAAEHGQALTLTGKTSAEAGQIVTVTLNGKNYTTTAGSDGTWSVELSASDVSALAEGNHSLTVNVSDKAGNGTSTQAAFSVDTAAPVVTIHTVAGDDILNAAEQSQAHVITGQASGAAAGDVVTLTIGGHTFTGVVQADGSWSVGVPASAIGSLGEGAHGISVSVTDAAGNTGTASHSVSLSATPPQFTVDAISQDNVLNAQEAQQPLTLSGTSNLPNGSAITVALNGVNYPATVENGAWSVVVPVTDVIGLANTLYTVTVSGTDASGNGGSAQGSLLVDTALPQVIINTFAGDNRVNNAEVGVDQTLSGRVSGAAAGDTVSITVGGKSYTATVDGSLNWSVTVPANDLRAFGDGDLTFTASVTNAHGNTGSGERDVNINAALPGLRINTVSGDDVINALEQQQDLTITGSSSHLAAGTQITVTLNGVEYPAVVMANGGWQIGVPVADLQSWTAGEIVVAARAQDAWGNTVAVEHPIVLDLNAVAVTLDTVSGDDMLNAAEKGAALTLSGQTQGVEAGQTVVVKFAGQTFTAQVQQDGSWSLTVPASAMESLSDGRAPVSVSVTNASGNGADTSRVVTVDTQAPALTIDALTDDNIINAADAQQVLPISGTSTAQAGQTVTVTLNGKTYTTTVQSDGTWQVNVPAADAGALRDGNVTVSASVSDVAGNPAHADRVGLVDISVPQVTIDNFVTDTNTVNQSAHGQAQVLSGSVTGAAAGDRVTVVINDVEYATVVDAAGNWSLGLPASVVKGLADGTWTITVSVTDAAGNTGSNALEIVVNTTTPEIAINTLAGDDVINATEKGENLTLSGTSNQPEGTVITVTLNGVQYAATADASGNWSVTVPASAVSALGEARYTVSASVTDSVGNAATASHEVQVDSTLPVVTFNTLAGDNVVNAAEVAAGQTLSGNVANAVAGDTVTVIIGGKTYTAVVQDDLSWSVPLSQAILTALGNGELTATASVTNAHGNTGSSSLDFTIDAQLPGLRIDTVAGDDVINIIEHGQNLIISGTSTDLAAGSVVTVTINGVSYSASVLADGSWKAAIPAADVAQWADGALTVSASAQDGAGNPVNIGAVVDVDLAPVAISINSITADNVLNAQETGADLLLSGTTANVEANQTVTITFGGKIYTATVEADGSWRYTVPASDLAGLKDGDASVQVSVTNANGNGASAGREYSVDTASPALVIEVVSDNNIINAAEAQQDLVIDGTTNAQAGQTVTVNLNGVDYTTAVKADGSWSVTVPAADLSAIQDGNYKVTASVSDKAGNAASAEREVLVDTSVPQLTINTVAGDDVINSAEHGQALIVSGSVTGAAAGDVVTVSLNGKQYTATLDGAGNWSVGVPASDVSALGAGNVTVTAALTDKAGNSNSTTHGVEVNLSAPGLTIDTVSGDDVINSSEKNQDLTLSGTASGLAAGAIVTVMLNGKAYSATVDDSGRWTTTVPAEQVGALGEALYTLTASATDANGNSGSASHTVSVESVLPGVIINVIAGDDVVNAAEIAVDQAISGKVVNAEAGNTVTVVIGGHTYTTTVQSDLTWSVNVPSSVLEALGDGELTVTASVTNGVGNSGTGERDVLIDASLPGLRIDTVAGDDVINSIEHGQNLLITGSSDGIRPGAALTVTVNGKTYAATVMADGSWTAAIPAADVGALAAGSVTVSVADQSDTGNPVSISHGVTVDLATVAISINAIAGDDVINAAEKGQDLLLSGTTSNVEENQTVTIVFGGKAYTVKVAADGSWTATVPSADLATLKDGDASVQVSVTNVNGNSASAGREYSVDATAPSVTINTVAGDDVLNAAEAQADVTVSGTSTAEAGQTVTVALNGKSYTATVGADGIWSVNVPAADAAALSDGSVTISASVSDKAGNPASVDHNLTVNVTVPTVTIHTVAGDDVINSAEHAQAQIISGTASGAAAGDRVTVTIGSQTYSTVLDASGSWSVGVPASVVSQLADGKVTISATVTDSAGNSATQTHEVLVNTASVSLTVNTVSSDDVINAAEAGSALVLSGTSTQLASGTQVTVTLNGKSYSATVQSDGSWSTTVPAADVANLADGASYSVSATAADGAGNGASANRVISVDTTAPVISIATLSGDDVLNAAEQQQPLTVHGASSAQAGQTVTVTLNGKSYTTTVASDGTWTLDVPAADLAALGQGALAITASVNDKAGNGGQASHTLTVDTVAPTVTIGTVASDDIINNGEQLAGQTISGTTTAEQGQIVTVTFNGHSYQATVDADGKWSVFVAGRDFLGLSDGSYTVTASVSDKAGNPGSATHDVTLSGDVPTIAINTFAQDDIVSAAEHGTPLVISGTTDAPAGQTVTITLNGKSYTATVQSDGSWRYTLGSADVSALADGGSYVIHATVSNGIGNSASSDHTVTVDLTAPSMGISIDSLQNDTGLSASDFITNDRNVVVNGSLTAQLGNNEKAQISLDGGVTWVDLTVTGTQWRYTDGRTLTDGTYQYQVRVVDNAGNVGATDSQNVVVDLTPPAATTITVDSVSQDTGLSNSDFITSDNQISLKGTLGAALASGEYAQISLDGGVTWIDVSVSGLSWTYVDGRTLADGDYNYQLRVIDDAGNVSATASQVVTIDTVAPDASKTVTIDSISDDTGLSGSDFITSDTSLTLHGSLGATLADGEYVQISLDGGNSWQNVTVVGNRWYYVDGRTLTDQTYDYWVRVIDTAGNVGASAHQQVTVDTVAPDAAITVTVDNITVDTGFDDNDFLTSATSYTLHGTLGAALGNNEFVQVSLDGGATWVYAMVNGTRWTYSDTRTLGDGDHAYQVRVVDLAGNVGATASQTVTVDTQSPQYGISIDAISEDTGQSGSDFITNDTSLTVSGALGSALAADERVQISLDGGTTWVDAVVNGKSWHYADGRTLTDGDYTYQVRIIDQAGNVGSTAQQVVTVDTTPPTTLGTVVSYSDNAGERQGDFAASVATDDTTPLINGTLNQALAQGEIAELYRDGVLLGKVTMNGATSWYFQDSGLNDGNHTYVLRVTDTAGNYTESDDFVLRVDTHEPSTTAAITAQTTADTTPILSGTVSAALTNGEYLVITVNGKTYTSETGGAVVVDPNHNTWYVQIPDGDALNVSSYSVTAQVKSSAGNGNTTGIATGSLTVETESVNTSWASAAGNTDNSTMTLGINSSGLWNIIANGRSYSSSDASSYTGTALTNTRSAGVVSQTSADFDRNGTADVFGSDTLYTNSTQIMWTYNGTSYTASQLAMGTTIWYGGVIAYDKTGDGYLDLAYGDAGMDSLTYLVNNKGTLTPDGTGGEGGFYGQFDSGREISGVDLNNDGTVDIVQHTNRSSNLYTLTVINNNGNGTLSVGQDITGVFVLNAANTTTAASMTWADFNGDGYMDLYLGSTFGNTGGAIYYNDGNGKLLTTKSAVEASNATAGYLSVAVDWNGDGQMDVIKLSTYGTSQTATLFTNNNHGSSWSTTQLASGLTNVTGVAALDYNWDGTKDLLIAQQNGKVVYVQNNQAIADGTAMHLRIVDSEGINSYYGNTVNLYNAAGVLVASQIINPQSGIGVNDSSALVSFYGLNPDETYSAKIVKITNGVSDNVTWDGLEAGNGKESYVLTADAATGGHSGTIAGTGYNDTFIADEGTYTYIGSGGWTTTSDHATWSNTGGMDVVDYRNATSGVTVDLSLTTAQNTGFNTTTLNGIEGIAGSNHDDVITGNSGDNLFEGRGGNDTFNIGSGGHDTLLYRLIDASDATGGNGSDVVNGFTVGTWEGTADTDRIDLRDLLSGSGYTGSGSASYVNGVATLDGGAGNITDYIRVVQNGSNTEIQIDRDGAGGQFDPTTVVTLNGVQTDLATLLANHQLLIA